MTSNSTRVDISSFATKMAAELDSLYSDSRFDRLDLLDFMDANQWFGIAPVIKDKAPTITEYDFEKIKGPLSLWLSAYKKPGRDKINLMLNHFSVKYPETCRLYRNFISSKHLEDKPAAWKLLEYMLSEIDGEITKYREPDLEALAKKMNTEATLQCARLFADFIQTAKHNGQPLTKWIYDFSSRGRPDIVNDAYSIESFAVMAYCVFNEDMWTAQNLIEKAVNSKAYADLWLFAALHFICALRSSDMSRLPAPALPYDGATVLEKISDGTFDKSEASALVEELSIRLKLKPLKPSKTAAHKKIPALKLFVPESLRIPLGIIMAISLAHHPEILPGEGFVCTADTRSIISGFFGKHFMTALGNNRLSTRRCNKSYLQGISNAADDSPSKPKGYMLAALARSHKGGIGSLAKTTDIYLRDASFTGYTPEFIIREMFERGVFSFIPAVLLEIYDGNKYKALPIGGQTNLIGELGFTANQIEMIVAATEHALVKSRSVVNSILENPRRVNENIGDILQNIASGNAPGRQDDCLCLMTAAGFPCHCPDRDSCIGCGYEIYTKTAMHTLMKEYTRLIRLKQSATPSESWRYEKMLEQAVFPAVSEMLSAAKLLYPDGSSEYLSIMEEGVKYADSGL